MKNIFVLGILIAFLSSCNEPAQTEPEIPYCNILDSIQYQMTTLHGGRVIQKVGFKYNSDNQLIEMIDDSGETQVTISYDVNGQLFTINKHWLERTFYYTYFEDSLSIQIVQGSSDRGRIEVSLDNDLPVYVEYYSRENVSAEFLNSRTTYEWDGDLLISTTTYLSYPGFKENNIPFSRTLFFYKNNVENPLYELNMSNHLLGHAYGVDIYFNPLSVNSKFLPDSIAMGLTWDEGFQSDLTSIVSTQTEDVFYKNTTTFESGIIYEHPVITSVVFCNQ
ncbi:hypothetical protein [Marinoscillum pacificum]|uniref:hypothetical protein n=1 Tax=Marinoscillum pacificum TaxID=392723 RepID=UPI0021587FF0|nr:hypothetical protein [Marinoscillum pacificum]